MVAHPTLVVEIRTAHIRCNGSDETVTRVLFFIRTIHVLMQTIFQVQAANGDERVFEHAWTEGIARRYVVFLEAIARGTLFEPAAFVSTQLWRIACSGQ